MFSMKERQKDPRQVGVFEEAQSTAAWEDETGSWIKKNKLLKDEWDQQELASLRLSSV